MFSAVFFVSSSHPQSAETAILKECFLTGGVIVGGVGKAFCSEVLFSSCNLLETSGSSHIILKVIIIFRIYTKKPIIIG